MFDATSPSEKAGAARWQGRVRVAYRCDAAGASRLAVLEQAAPLRALRPYQPTGEPPCVAITNTAGGLVGGDRLSVAVTAEAGARLIAMAQAAEKVYRSAGPDVTVSVDLAAGPGSWLEWLPQETILFDRARLRRETCLEIDTDATVLAGEMLVLGRTAFGERVTSGLIRDAWRVRLGGRLAWADALHMEGDIARLQQAPAGFNGAVAMGTILAYAPTGAAEALVEAVRESLPATAGATVVGGLLLIRFLDRDAQRLREEYGRLWGMLRQALGGYAPVLPRLWHV